MSTSTSRAARAYLEWLRDQVPPATPAEFREGEAALAAILDEYEEGHYEPSGGRTSCGACDGNGCDRCCDPAEFTTDES